MVLKVYTEGVNAYRAIVENERGHVAGMLFSSYTDLIAFILDMPITAVKVLIHSQSTVAYGYRLDSTMIRDSIDMVQATRRGKNKRIEVFNY